MKHIILTPLLVQSCLYNASLFYFIAFKFGKLENLTLHMTCKQIVKLECLIDASYPYT